MAQDSKEKDDREVDEEEPSEETGSSETLRVAEDQALAKTDGAGGEDAAEGDGKDGEGEDGEEGEALAAGQLGSDRYVLAGFFAMGMLGAYVLGRALQGLWMSASNKDWFSQSLPRLAAVSDDDKGAYSIVLGGIIALVAVYRTYRRSDVRAWADEVAAELAKVVWPSQKDVTNSTFIVIVASAVATIYLALLDRLWAFVTNIVYGDGS